MALVFLIPLPFPFSIALSALLAASLTHSLRVHGWRRAGGAITAFELDHEGLCSVQLGKNPDWHECDVLRAVVHPRFVLLSLRIKCLRWPRGLVLAGNAVEPEAFRRLRGRLSLETRAV